MPGICKVFGETLDGKRTFRKRYEDIQKQMSLTLDIEGIFGTENTVYKIINIRVMGETEAKYRRMNSGGSELVYETQPAQIITCEKRQSRILSGMVSITTYDTSSNADRETPKDSNAEIQSIKTKLFKQNQQQFVSQNRRQASSSTRRKLVHSKSMKVSPIVNNTERAFFPNPVTEYFGIDVKPLTPKASTIREGTTFGWSTMRTTAKVEAEGTRQKTEPHITTDTRTPVKPMLKFTFSDSQGTCADDAPQQMSEVKKPEPSLTPKGLHTLKRMGSTKILRRMPSLDFQGNNLANLTLNKTMSTIDKRMLSDTNSEASLQKPSSREGLSNPNSDMKNSLEEIPKGKESKDVEIAVSRPKIFIINRGNIGPTIAMVRPTIPRNLGLLGKKGS